MSDLNNGPISNIVVFFRCLGRKGEREGLQLPELQPESLSDFREKKFRVRFRKFFEKKSGKKIGASLDSDPNRKISQSPVSRNSNIERRMDRPKAVVGVIRGVALTVNVSCLLWAGSGIYGVRYLRAISYF